MRRRNGTIWLGCGISEDAHNMLEAIMAASGKRRHEVVEMAIASLAENRGLLDCDGVPPLEPDSLGTLTTEEGEFRVVPVKTCGDYGGNENAGE